nr:MAG: hypothetical protein TU35_08770 [Thermoproteus sp. AZ2]
MLVFAATRGGQTRLEIVKALRDRPMNANQLAKALGLDYKTVRYHLEVLAKHGLVEKIGDSYGAIWSISPLLRKYWVLLP